MAFLLNRSGKQLVRLSSSWATQSPLVRVVTSVNNCFSTAASSSSSSLGGMIQESNPVLADPALKDLTVNFGGYISKIMVDTIQNKPLPSTTEFHTFLDDLFSKLPRDTKDSASETGQAEKNPTDPEMIKATAVLVDTLTGGLLKYLPKPDFKVKGDNFNFTRDTNALYLTVNVLGLAKEHLVVWVIKERVIVTSKIGVASDQKVFESIWLPDDHIYDVDEVTGTIMEDGQLKISFPVSMEGRDQPKEKYFEVKLV